MATARDFGNMLIERKPKKDGGKKKTSTWAKIAKKEMGGC